MGDGDRVGGIAGEIGLGSQLSESINNGKVTGKSKNTGGIAGIIFGAVDNCINNGPVTGENHCVGGIVGIIFGNVDNCINTAKVTAINSGEGVGGVVGEIGTNCAASISNCYNTADVEGSGDGTAGIVGYLSVTGTKGTISNNYNVGAITGNSNVGGVVGRTASTFIINTNYALKGCAPTIVQEEEKETADMKKDDFITLLNTVTTITKVIDEETGEETGETTTTTSTQDVWKKDTNNINNGYPILKWQ